MCQNLIPQVQGRKNKNKNKKNNPGRMLICSPPTTTTTTTSELQQGNLFAQSFELVTYIIHTFFFFFFFFFPSRSTNRIARCGGDCVLSLHSTFCYVENDVCRYLCKMEGDKDRDRDRNAHRQPRPWEREDRYPSVPFPP